MELANITRFTPFFLAAFQILKEPTILVADDSLQTAMAKTIDFVGESIPILSRDKKFLECVVSEGSIFQAVIDVQDSVSKIGRA